MGNRENTECESRTIERADHSPKVAHLVNTAGLLFAKYGFHAIGIDRIISESGIAKMTMYRNFPKKNDLILSVLIHRRAIIRKELMHTIANKNTPSERISAIFEWFRNCVCGTDFYGCIFTRAASEFLLEDDGIVDVARKHKEDIINTIHCALVDAPSQEYLAERVAMLIDGAIISETLYRGSGALRNAEELALSLLHDLDHQEIKLRSRRKG
ncbi:TetR/AcrR family transcriptional regulator [Gluconacetobacter entanii]|uniref:TetR/AcrR family transcriptional regulator n=1 Tax=Gluconacetobacter entanii TaxID=108528 RepID=UPI001C933B52|nr:TetR/AcrR family transcriptional regulator [Gluconacetobacter entanii]MBY4640951.1 TetR/AcrR family transcriptional regulator [Gluconacetobacter entanii]MCW4579038.1 TetR/AcrR family transcriptional regulator [Gluconacetobacter entanii]MCW4582438.1 TetR/AcrR family transcriptional regulator [Gluconacetobacter entanii]MCW4585831.1 TetR/AcrR family transcriptional regulator [Gluconacetobacter entanii]